MSTIDTSTWNPDADLNVEIDGIPLNSNASIAQTWQALRVLMAAVKGDGDAVKSMIDVMQGATASVDGASGLVPKPEAGDQDKVLKGDGTWGTVAASSVAWSDVTGKPSTFTPSSHVHGNIANDGKLGTASRAVVTDGDKKIAVSSVTAAELDCLSGVTGAVQTQIDLKADDSSVVHNSGNENISGNKTFAGRTVLRGGVYGINKENAEEDANDLYVQLVGARQEYYTTSSSGTKLDNVPEAVNTIIESRTIRRISDSDWRVDQTLHNLSGLYYRRGSSANGGTWTSWKSFAFDLNAQSLQTTSDGRLKTPPANIPDAVLDAWESVEWEQFQYLDAVEEKGEGAARQHLGLIAQRVKAVFEARKLDACAYGILCLGADDVWAIRYEEALAMEAAYQRRRADRLEARIAVIEEKLNG